MFVLLPQMCWLLCKMRHEQRWCPFFLCLSFSSFYFASFARFFVIDFIYYLLLRKYKAYVGNSQQAFRHLRTGHIFAGRLLTLHVKSILDFKYKDYTFMLQLFYAFSFVAHSFAYILYVILSTFLYLQYHCMLTVSITIERYRFFSSVRPFGCVSKLSTEYFKSKHK